MNPEPEPRTRTQNLRTQIADQSPGLTVGSSGALTPAAGTLFRNSYSAPASSVVSLLKHSHGIGDPAYFRPPRWKRATNVSRSGNRFRALPASGVRLGGANQSD